MEKIAAVDMALVLTCLGRGSLETLTGAPFGAVLFMGLAGFLVWRLLITFEIPPDA